MIRTRGIVRGYSYVDLYFDEATEEEKNSVIEASRNIAKDEIVLSRIERYIKEYKHIKLSRLFYKNLIEAGVIFNEV